MRFDTRLVHIGQEPDGDAGDLVPPIHLTTTYERRSQDPPGYFYARGENQTREALERSLAALENARYATVFSSGQAAGVTALTLLEPGQRVIVSDDVYGGTYALLASLDRYGIAADHVDLTDQNALDAALDDDVALIWIESPTNPLLKVADLTAICRRAAKRGVRVLVDNTFASPALQQPLRCGADMTLYSTTKSIAGHSDVLGGALVYDDEELHRAFRSYRTVAGNVPGPLDCYLVHRGLKTLSLRVARQSGNAAALVAALRDSESVGVIHYPGLLEHPQYDVARRQMAAPGSVFSFEYLGDPARLLDQVRLFACAPSLGGVRSLIGCPAATTHAAIPPATRRALGISDNLLRVSTGIEDPTDLVDDLMAALRPEKE